MAFKTPKSSIFITNVGILNAKKKHFKCHNWYLKMPKMDINFFEMDPMLRPRQNC